MVLCRPQQGGGFTQKVTEQLKEFKWKHDMVRFAFSKEKIALAKQWRAGGREKATGEAEVYQEAAAWIEEAVVKQMEG